MIKDILLHVSRSYNPYVPVREMWGAGQTFAGELDNDFNARKFIPFDTGNNWDIISTNGNNAMAIKTDGTLWQWGPNISGQLGFNDTVTRSSPVQLGTLTWVSASAQNQTSYAIKSDGTLWTWGDNSGGNLGFGDLINRSSPVQLGTNVWKNIFGTGLGHVIALRGDDTIWGWGDTRNAFGVYGNGERPGAFGQIDGGSLDWSDFTVGASYTIAVGSDGRMWGWGLNTSGQLGLNDVTNRSNPTQIGLLSTWVSASADGNSGNHTLAIQNNGTLWAWGSNSSGQLGLNDLINRSSPVQIGTDTNWYKAAPGSGFSIGLKTDGTMWSWGTNAAGLLGQSSYELRQIDNLTTWVSGSFNGNHILALKTDGTMWTWGGNNLGELGLNDLVTRSSPVQIGTRLWKKISVSSATNSSFGIRDDDTLWSWGSNSFGGLGLGGIVNRSSPVQVGTRTWTEISNGQVGQTLAIRSDGTLWAWGWGTNGALGQNNTTNFQSPVQIGTRADWSKVSMGHGNNAFAIRTDGTLWAWGENVSYGTLGLGDKINRSSPVQVGTRADWVNVRTGRWKTGAIRSDGTLWTWGINDSGQLGLGDKINRSSPVQVGTETNWLRVQFNEAINDTNGSFAIKTDKTLWGWSQITLKDNINTGGVNLDSFSSPVQIGVGEQWETVTFSGGQNPVFAITSNNKLYSGPGLSPSLTIWGTTGVSSPIQVGTETNWAKINAGGNKIHAIKTDGTLWGWGLASYGFPIINFNYSSVGKPTLVTSDNWQKVQGGASNNLIGIKADGTLWAWGVNTFGELGFGDQVTRSSPVQVGTRLWNDVSIQGGTANTLAIRSDGTLWGWGRNNAYQLGLNDIISRSSPVQIGGDTNWLYVAAGSGHTAAIKNRLTKELHTAGVANTYTATYRVVNGWDGTRRSPILLSQSGVWNKIIVGVTHTLGIKPDGTLWSWGLNSTGELGLNDLISRSSPVQVGTLNNWLNAFGLSNYTVAIQSDNTLWGWGSNATYGNLGLNDTINRSSPVQIGTNLWTNISGNGNVSTFGIRNDGTLWVWGNNQNGELGENSTIFRSSPVQIGTETNWLNFGKSQQKNRGFFAINSNKSMYVVNGIQSPNAPSGISFYKSSPVQVTSTRNWRSVSAGTSFTIAISTSGSIWAWGTQTNGVIGNNIVTTGANQESPVQIGTLTTWASASAGEGNVVAIRNDNTIWTWGANTAGQLAQNDLVSRSSPVQVGTLTNWSKVSAGRSHVMAIKTDGTLWGWGINTTNNIGDTSSTNRSSPVQIGTRTDWSKVSTGDGHTMAINTAGELYGMGWGNTGQIGLNTVNNANTPNRIGTETWTDVAAGQQMTVAVRSNGTLWSWGTNAFGQLGILRNRSLPNYVVRPPLFTNTKAYFQSAFGRSTDGTLWAWGGNSAGQLGLNDTVARSSPVQVGTLTWSDISPGTFHTNAISNGRLFVWGSNTPELGLMQYGAQYLSGSNIWTDAQVSGIVSGIFRKNDGTLWGVGGNSVGELGFNNTVRINSPVQIGTRTWNSYSVGNQTTLAIRNDGTLWGWGRNTSAELGLDINRNVPQYVNTTQTWKNAKVGNQYAIAHNTDGTLWGWGTNSLGQLGLNDIVFRSSPVQIGTETNWKTYHTGHQHTIAIKTDGTLWSWGLNTNGELGLNDTVIRSSPVQVGTLNNWSEVTVGLANNYSIKTDGTLWSWGGNSSGQLGLNDTINRSSPVQVGTETNWKKLAKTAVSVSHMMAIRNDNTLWYWGNGASGKLGNNTSTSISSPVQLGTETNWAVISLSVDNSYAVKTDGTLWSWGLNNFGQLGLNLLTTAHRSSPVQVGTLNTWLDVSAGTSFTMAIQTNNTLWGWGINTNAQIGDGTIINRSSPVQIGTLSTWVSASAGSSNTVFLQNNGYALTTGNGVHPGWDIDFLLNRSSPVQIGTQSNWSYVSVGAHSAAVRTDGTLWTWGLNTSGQLGIGVSTNRSSAVQVGTDTNWATAYTIGSKTYGIKTNGTLWAWGSNLNGELGQNNFGALAARSSPVQIGTLTWSNVARGTTSDSLHVVAIRTDGTLWSWGSNSVGQLGQNDLVSRSSPVQIGTRSDWVSATIGASNTMAVRSDGTLWSWGANTSNQVLGQNDNINRSSPVQVGTLSTWVSASLDTNYSVLLQNNGDAYTTALYNNDFALFGVNRSSPVQVGTLSNWAQVDGGYQYSLAVKQDGTLWGWGYNVLGSIGDRTSTNRSSPVQIGTDTNWSRVSAGYLNSHALKTDGTLWAWGYNGISGVLGLNDSANRSSPVQVGTRTWLSVADKAGYQLVNDVHVLAVRSDGTLWTWGSNLNGALGLNVSPGFVYSSPVQIGTETNWISAAVGDNTSMAIRSNGTLWAWGLNTNAELGLGDTVNRSSPVQVGTLSNWVSASFGQANSVLLQNNGYGLTTGIYAHGYDILPYTINRSSPAQIGADTDWVRVAAGYVNFSGAGNQIIAQKSDGTLWTWGSNTAGNLGDGTLIGKSSPVQIGNETTWVDFGAQLHFVGIKNY